MSLNNLENVTELFLNDATTTASRTIDLATLTPKRSTEISQDTVTPKAIRTSESKHLDTSRSSDSGKSSSCSPTLLDCSFDSGIAGVLLDSNNMQLHKQIQQCQRIILALERDREHFCTIRKRLSKISERKKKQLIDSEYFCNVCCAEIDPEDAKTYVKCYICQKHICRSIKCADWLAKTAQWECELCQTSKESMAQTSSWVADQISFNQEKFVYPIRARSEIFIPISDCNDSSIHFESVSQIGANSAAVTAEQKHKIREYVEEVVANLLGGNLDTISVNQLSKSENYLPAPKSNGPFGQQNGSVILSSRQTSREVTPISANDPDFSHISENRLRQMILKIIAETQNMPSSLTTTHAVSEIALDRLSKTADNMPLTNGHRHRTEHYFEPTIYQDLLATAVLNKIVDKQLNSHDISERLPDLTRGDDGDDDDCHVNAVLDENFNVEHHSITSGSSVEPRSDCSFTDMEQILNTNDDKSLETNIINADRESVMSDYLANHMVPLPNLSEMATESEEDDYMSVTSSAVGDGTWENNWLFKKKKPTLGGTVTATSIGMLVPDPKEDVRAKIGDKAADEVSDLSELGSDTDDSLDLLRSKLDPINDRLINKHLIGGQNSKEVLDELIERSSMTSNKLPTELEETFTETCNEHLIDAATKSTKSEAINVDVIKQPSRNTEQEDAEFILPPAGFEDLNSNPLTGSIAEREYKKWNNAVEMPNNPYAPEALKRRISGSQERFIDLPNISPTQEQNPIDIQSKNKLDVEERENDYKRYSRDYYINNGSPSSQTSPARETAATPTKDISIEVNNYNYNNNNNNNHSYEINSHNARKENPNDCHWKLSTPVRRSSSLKFLNPPQASAHPSTSQQHRSSILQPRPSTSASYYNYNHNHNHNHNNNHNIRKNEDDDDSDLHSQRSWKSSSDLCPKRRTLSMLSVVSNSSRCSNLSRHTQPDSNVLTQFEKQLLHKDLKRNSFRAVSATTKDFVINPLYEKEQFFHCDGALKLSIAKSINQSEKPQQPTKQHEDQGGDSGVDSCLNGFTEKDIKSKYDEDSLLF